jgi:hypothetical protein
VDLPGSRQRHEQDRIEGQFGRHCGPEPGNLPGATILAASAPWSAPPAQGARDGDADSDHVVGAGPDGHLDAQAVAVRGG